MDLAAQHALAILPKRFTVLGQTLEPFTLGHALLLTRLASPYAPFSDHGRAGLRPGQSGQETDRGRAGLRPGQSGADAAALYHAHGRAGLRPGQSGADAAAPYHAHGRAGLRPGQSGADAAAPDHEVEGIGELVTAIWVCAQPWRVAEKHLASRRTRLLLRAWRWQLTSAKLTRAAAFFQAYLVESARGPRTFTKDTDSALRSPTLAVIRVMLANAFGLTPDAAMDVPLATALWDLACYHELKGSVELVDSIRAAALEAARQPAAN